MKDGISWKFNIIATNLFDVEHIEYPVWDATNEYINTTQKERYLNRNALNDRKVIATLQVKF